MQKKSESHLEYFRSAIAEGKIHHSFNFIGEHEDLQRLAKQKARELDGEYLIISSFSGTFKVIVSYEHNLLTTNLDQETYPLPDLNKENHNA